MTNIKAAFAELFDWVETTWSKQGAAAILALVLGFAAMSIVQRLI